MKPNTVYGSLMHHRAELLAIGEAAEKPPYHCAPQAPVLYIKPANTFCAFGEALPLPAAHSQIMARACLGLIYEPNHDFPHVGREEFAIKKIVNTDWKMALLCDFSLPHASFYRPPLRFNALDGSLALPQSSLAFSENDVKDARIETWVNGVCAHSYTSFEWACPALAQLLAVSEFIAWEAGDVLMLGCPPDAPRVKAGDTVETRMFGHIFTRTSVAQEAA
jgi:5-oxopent-3-ene-1,2,5-tricarboxylate decarboxylase / 2-hydroxyhepta-2,4-diene-1,7-dioate isomerase